MVWWKARGQINPPALKQSAHFVQGSPLNENDLIMCKYKRKEKKKMCEYEEFRCKSL